MFNSAWNMICDEHRSLAAVVQGLRHLVEECRRDSTTPDFKLLRAIVFYLDEFPQKLHHPKEDAYLFARLMDRTRAADGLIAELREQHASGSRYVEALHATLAAFEANEAKGLDAFPSPWIALPMTFCGTWRSKKAPCYHWPAVT